MSYPVITALEMRRIEQLAVQAGCSEEAFMTEAGRLVAGRVLEWIESFHLPKSVAMLVGKGNKGGDAFVAGICLLEKGIRVRAVTLFPERVCSPLNQKFRKIFTERGGVCMEEISFDEDGLIVDGLLGTGFHGKIDPQIAAMITLANSSGKPILAIDIPSGLDGSTGEVDGEAIVADETLTLGCFKLGFYLGDGWNRVGNIILGDFGLPEQYVEKATFSARILAPESLLMPSIVRNRHKYEAGYVMGFSGSKTFRGAPKLAGMAALRSGSGIVRVFHLEDIGETPISLICQKWDAKTWKKEKKRASALFIGPGIGKSPKMLQFLKKELKNIQLPMVIDADAIQKGIVYPSRAILTPHRGEVLRLIGNVDSEEDLMVRCQKWVNQTKCILVLKGAPTWVFSDNDLPVIIPQGDPGMAKAGTGDVLTGIIASLLAQKMEPLNAAVLGCTLHALAGETAAQEKTSYGMIAEDLISYLPHAIMKHRHGVVGLEPFDEAEDSLF